MNGTLSNIIIFAAGAAIGSVVTWKLLKDKYEQIAQEEIDSIKEAYTYEKDDTTEESKDEEEDESDQTETGELPRIRNYAAKLQEQNYTYYSNPNPIREEVADEVKPRIITPDEFGEMEEEGYDIISLIYYADGVLTDDFDNPIEDIPRMVPEDFSSHFGEYEEDSIFVRNDRIKADIEILRSEKTSPTRRPPASPDDDE